MISWWLILALSIVTFFNRYLFFSKSIKYIPSKKMTHLLSFSAQAVMTALWAPIVFQFNKETTFVEVDYHYLVPATLVMALSLWRVNVLVSLVAGMGVFYILRSLA